MEVEKVLLHDYTNLEKACDSWKTRKSLWGLAPVAPIHLGYDPLILLQKQAINLGVKRHYIIIADLHALMSKGMAWDEIRARSFYYEFYFKEICKLENTDFILGSYFQTRQDYIEELYSCLREIPLAKVRDSMPSATKNQTVYSLVAVYSLMQCLDAFHVNANYVLAEKSQEKIYDLVSEIVKIPILRTGIQRKFTTGVKKITFGYVESVHDIRGQNLNLSSTNTRISIHENEASLNKKIDRMFVPAHLDRNLTNPMLEHFKFSVLPWFESISIVDRNGRKRDYYTYNDFEEDYYKGIFNSIDAKNALKEKLKMRIMDIQSLMSRGISNWVNIDKITTI